MKVVDLSQVIHAGMPVFPGAEQVIFKQVCDMAKDGCRVAQVTMNFHVGTHIDAPAHMLKDGCTLDQLSPDYFMGRAVMVDVSNLQRETITMTDLQKYEEVISNSDYIILKTGWNKYWGDDKYFGAFPALTEEAAKWLMKFELKGIGVDTISIDRIADVSFPIHKILLAHKVLIVENLTNLDAIEADSFEFFCLPLKIKDTDGSPVRAIAVIS